MLVPRKPIGPCSYDDRNETTGHWTKNKCEGFEEELDRHRYRVVKNAGEPPTNVPERTVPPDAFFVEGDNRDNSSDSRVWGFLPAASVTGTARIVGWSMGPDGVGWDRLNQRVQ